MSIAAIIGAGSIGGNVAAGLAARDRFREVRLIDHAANAAAGTALDIQQAGAIERSATRLTSSAELHHALGARVAVLADPARPEEVQEAHDVERTIATVRTLIDLDPTIGIVCATPCATPAVERAVRESTVPWTQIVGSAPVALASAVRALVALTLDGSPADVALTVLGVPPSDIVVPWSQVTLSGDRVDRRLAQPDLRRLERRLRCLWPPGPYGLASAAVRVSEAMVFGSLRLFCCGIALSGEFGTRERAQIVPVRFGPARAPVVRVPALRAHERVAVENALDRTA